MFTAEAAQKVEFTPAIAEVASEKRQKELNIGDDIMCDIIGDTINST